MVGKTLNGDGICVCPLCLKEPFTPGCATCSNIEKYEKDTALKLSTEAESQRASQGIPFPGPGLIKSSPLYGNYVVASRDIQPGELIIYERPLLVSPYAPSHLIPLCLSCTKDISPAAKCSVCKWPICDLKCQKNELHGLNECEIFARNSLRSKGIQDEYFGIETLRCLLTRTSAPHKWKRILSFEAHKSARAENTKAKESLRFITKFIRLDCKLEEYDEDLIDHVVGILSVNTFWAFKDLQRYTSVLFDKVTLFAHDCDPNTVRKLVQPTKREINSLDEEEREESLLPDYFASNSEIAIEIHASRPIEKGEMITIRYVDVSQPLHQRRQELKEIFYFDCACSKCLTQLMDQSLVIDRSTPFYL